MLAYSSVSMSYRISLINSIPSALLDLTEVDVVLEFHRRRVVDH